MSRTEFLAHSISLIMIVIYSLRFFNQPLYEYSENVGRFGDIIRPAAPKLMTESAVYRFYQSIFVGLIVALYFMVTFIIDTAPAEKLNNNDIGLLIDLVKEHREASSIVSALIIIGITKYPRWISEVIESLRNVLHHYASIPESGRDLFDRLMHSKISYDEDGAKNRIDKLLRTSYTDTEGPREDIGRSFFKEKFRTTLEWKWARLSYLIYCVDEYGENREIKKYLAKYALGWRRLKSEYKEYIDGIILKRNNELEKEEETALKKEIDNLLCRMYRLISCLLIMTSKTERDPLRWLEDRGFNVSSSEREMIPKWRIFRASILVIVTISLATFLAGRLFYIVQSTGEMELSDYAIFNTSAFIIMLIPVIFVFCVKRYLSAYRDIWPWIEEKEIFQFEKRRWHIYLSIAMISWIVSTILMRIFLFLGPMHMADNTDTQKHIIWPFTFIAAITALFAAYRIDIPPFGVSSKKKLYMFRVSLALIQGTVTAAAVYMAYLIVVPSILVNNPVRLYFHSFLGFVAGVTLGFTLFLGKHSVASRFDSDKMQYF